MPHINKTNDRLCIYIYTYIYCQNSYPLGKHLNVSQWMSGMAPWQRLEWSQAGSLTALCQPVHPKTRRSLRSSMLFRCFHRLNHFESQRLRGGKTTERIQKESRCTMAKAWVLSRNSWSWTRQRWSWFLPLV